MKTKVKNLCSILRFECRLYPLRVVSFVINITTLIYAIIQYYHTDESRILVLVYIVFANIIWKCISTFREFIHLLRDPKYEIKDNLPNNYSEFKIEDTTKELYNKEVIDEKNKVYLIYSDISNERLRDTTPLIAKLDDTKLKDSSVVAYIKKCHGLLVLFLQTKWHSGVTFFSERKVSLLSDIEGNNKIKIRKGDYYYSFLTNEVFCKCLKENIETFPIYPPMAWQMYTIHKLGQTSDIMSNHIGVSTMAITTDNHIIILKHNRLSAVHPESYQPSGSGSADFSDLKLCKNRSGYDFKDFIILSAERELYEETQFGAKNYNSYKKNYIKETIITGFYRDIIRGGKPDFCCITKLTISSKDLNYKPDSIENDKEIKSFSILSNNHYDFTELDSFLHDNESFISPGLVIGIKFMKETLSLRPNF